MLDRSEVGKRGYLDRDFRLVHLKDSLAQKIDYHYHEFDKLVIFLGGKVTYVVEGVTYFLKPWDIVLIQHNLIHRPIIHAEEPYERAVLWLGRDWIAQRSDPGEPLDACLDKSREQGFHLLRTGEEGRLGYARFIQQLEEALRSEEFGARRMADTLCQQLLIQVNRDFLRANTAPNETDSYHLDPKMEEILRYIAANLGGRPLRGRAGGPFLHEPVLPNAPVQGDHRLHRPPVHRTEAAAAGRRADPGGRSGDEGGGTGGLSGVFHLPPGLSEHLPYQPEEFSISAPSVCVYRKRIIANKINAPPSGGALIVY